LDQKPDGLVWRPTQSRLTPRQVGRILVVAMVAELYLQAEVVGCPTVCRHCWAQGVPYQAMPVGEVAWVLEQAHAFCDEQGLGFGAYPMHEVASHPQAAEILRLFADHVGAASVDAWKPSPTTSSRPWHAPISAPAGSATCAG
jgi:hypothetical protein